MRKKGLWAEGLACGKAGGGRPFLQCRLCGLLRPLAGERQETPVLPQPDGRHLTLGPSGPAYPPPPQPRTLGMERCSSLYPGVSTSTNPAPPSLLHRSQVQWQPPQRGLSRPLELLGFSLPSMFLVCPAYQRMSAGGGLSRCLPRAGWLLSAALESRWAEALASLLELSYKGALGSPRRPTYCSGAQATPG